MWFVFIFGFFIVLMMIVLVNYFVLLSLDCFDICECEIVENVIVWLLIEGVFMYFNEYVIFYIFEIIFEGVLKNLFMYD